MVDGNSLYSFAARKANDLWPVANLHRQSPSEFRVLLRLTSVVCVGIHSRSSEANSCTDYHILNTDCN